MTELVKDAEATRRHIFDYDGNIHPDVTLYDAGTISVIPSGVGYTDVHVLPNARAVQVTFYGGVRGVKYQIRHAVETNEINPQTMVETFTLRIT